MLDIFERFAVNVDAEEHGVWVDFHGARLKIARTGNNAFNKLVAKKYEENRKVLETRGEEAEKLADTVMVEAFADTIVMDWEGIRFKGEELPYSREAVIDVFARPEMREFRREVLAIAEDFDNFRMKEDAEQEKN